MQWTFALVRRAKLHQCRLQPNVIYKGDNATASQLTATLLNAFGWSTRRSLVRARPPLYIQVQRFLPKTVITSSQMYPQKAGATVKSMKEIFQVAWKHGSLDDRTFTRALLQYHEMPSQMNQLSPVQKFFGLTIQPTHSLPIIEYLHHSGR